MPLYEFRCETCGPFEQWRALSETGIPMICPTCEAVTKRVYSAIGLITTPYALRYRIEQGAEPKVVTRPQSEESAHKHQAHGHKSHQHSHAHHGRPWMVGH